MFVDLAREQGNPRQVRRLAVALGPAAPDADRLLRRLRHWVRDDGDAATVPLRPSMLARRVGWRGDPAVLADALTKAGVAARTARGLRLRRPAAGFADAQPDSHHSGARLVGGRPALAGEAAGPDRSGARTSPPAPVLWRAALGELAAVVNRANFEVFLADTVGLYRSGGWLTVGVPTTYALVALAGRFRGVMAWALYVASGERLGVRLVHAPPPGPPVRLPIGAAPDASGPAERDDGRHGGAGAASGPTERDERGRVGADAPPGPDRPPFTT